MPMILWGFQHRTEAEQFLKQFRERLAKFGLELHADKTRLIEFGRFAARNRKQRGEGKPETFTFLGFTHFCGQLTTGAFIGFFALSNWVGETRFQQGEREGLRSSCGKAG